MPTAPRPAPRTRLARRPVPHAHRLTRAATPGDRRLRARQAAPAGLLATGRRWDAPQSAGRRRLRARRRSRRRALAVIVGLVAMAALALSGLGMPGGPDPAVAAGGEPSTATHDPVGAGEGAEPVAVVLGEGETAWEALRAHTPAGVDHTVFVVDVLRANDVDARTLRPGDVLVVEDG